MVWSVSILHSGATEHIAGTEAIGMANGIGSDGSDFYVSDSVAGAIWRVTIPFGGTRSRRWSRGSRDPLLAGTGAMPLPFPVGANGVALTDQVVYVGVTEQSQVVGIPISSDGSAGEPFVYLELPGVAIDGIAIRPVRQPVCGGPAWAHPLEGSA